VFENKKLILEKNLERFDFYIEKADNKASFILAFAATLIVGILLETDKILSTSYKIFVGHLVILIIILLITSIIFSLLVIIPRTPRMNIDSCMFFESINDMSLTEYKDKLNNLQDEELINNEMENETYELSKICHNKMINIKISLIFLSVSIIFMTFISFVKVFELIV